MPIPLRILGSVSARLRVWFSAVMARRKSSRVESGISSPPRSNWSNCCCPLIRCREARFFDEASVISRVPFGKSNAPRPLLGGILHPAVRHNSRPLIIRCRIRKNSSSNSSAIRFPMRLMLTTHRPSTDWIGGLAVRRRKGWVRRTLSRRCFWIKWRRRSTYTSTSGYSGSWALPFSWGIDLLVQGPDLGQAHCKVTQLPDAKGLD